MEILSDATPGGSGTAQGPKVFGRTIIESSTGPGGDKNIESIFANLTGADILGASVAGKRNVFFLSVQKGLRSLSLSVNFAKPALTFLGMADQILQVFPL